MYGKGKLPAISRAGNTELGEKGYELEQEGCDRLEQTESGDDRPTSVELDWHSRAGCAMLPTGGRLCFC